MRREGGRVAVRVVGRLCWKASEHLLSDRLAHPFHPTPPLSRVARRSNLNALITLIAQHDRPARPFHPLPPAPCCASQPPHCAQCTWCKRPYKLISILAHALHPPSPTPPPLCCATEYPNCTRCNQRTQCASPASTQLRTPTDESPPPIIPLLCASERPGKVQAGGPHCAHSTRCNSPIKNSVHPHL